jgi:hypothetical protein
LSFRARGIAVRLLSNVDGYSTTAQDLAGESPREGRDAVLAAMRELEARGYLVRIRHRNPDGTFRTEAYISDTPQTENGFAAPGQSGPGEPSLAISDSARPEPAKPSSKAARPEVSNTNTTTTCEVGLSWPVQLDEAEVVVVRRMIGGMKHEEQQQLLDELAGALGSPKPPRQMASWLRALRMRMEAGEFMPDMGLAIIKERQRRIAEEEDHRRKAAERKQEEEKRNDPEFSSRSEAARKEAIAAINEQLNIKKEKV